MLKEPVSLSALMEAQSYRTPMRVAAVRYFHRMTTPSSFPVCPRCHTSMEREYQAYCDRCGQALNWKGFRKAVVIMSR